MRRMGNRGITAVDSDFVTISESLKKAIDEIRDGTFARMLDAEEAKGYPTVAGFYVEKDANLITKTEDEIKCVIRKTKAEPAAR